MPTAGTAPQMKLLTAELRKLILPLGSQKGSSNPTVYAKFIIPGSNRAWYITEGEERDNDFLFFGYENCCRHKDHHQIEGEYFPLSFLYRAGEIVGSHIQVDSSFSPQRLSEVEEISVG